MRDTTLGPASQVANTEASHTVRVRDSTIESSVARTSAAGTTRPKAAKSGHPREKNEHSIRCALCENPEYRMVQIDHSPYFLTDGRHSPQRIPEISACGVGFAASLDGVASSDPLQRALHALDCMEHRGGCLADQVTDEDRRFEGLLVEVRLELDPKIACRWACRG